MASEIICIIDRSGSMAGMAKEAIGGFNQFLTEQKALPDDSCKFTLVLFDHDYNKIYDAVDIQDVAELNETTYVPRGTTALFDAMGRALDDAIDRIQKEYSEKPRMAVMVMTDGQENASKDYKKDRLEKLVEDLKKEGWQFVFMSSDLNSFQNDLQTMSAVGTMNVVYNNNSRGYTASYANVSQSMGVFREQGIVSTAKLDLTDDAALNPPIKVKKPKIHGKNVV